MGDKFPYVHDPATDFVTQSTAARENKQGEALANLINSLPVFKVDPDNAECYATVNAAYAAANANLPAGRPIRILLAPNQTHALAGSALTLDGRHDVFIKAAEGVGEQIYWPIAYKARVNTQVTGDITLTANVESSRRAFVLDGVHHVGDLTGGSNWSATIMNCLLDGVVSRTHGAEGFKYEAFNCSNNDVGFNIADTDTSTNPYGAYVYLQNCKFWFDSTAGNSFVIRTDDSICQFVDCLFAVYPTGSFSFLDSNDSGNNPTVHWLFVNTTIELIGSPDNSTLTLLEGAGGETVYGNGLTIVARSLWNINFNGGSSSGDYDGAIALLLGEFSMADATLTSPPLGLCIHDKHEVLIWDGTYWSVGARKRKIIDVNVGTAAADHDVGWDAPASSYIIRSRLKLLKAITGASGATKVGLGTGSGGDPDKYGKTTALTSNSKGGQLNGTWADGGGTDLKLTAVDDAGAATGTIAGSGSADVRVCVDFELYEELE